MSRKQVIVFLVVMLIVTAFAFWKADFIERYGSVAQVWIMVMLVLLTAAYVLSTRKMAEEMRNTRYDALRPILDIVEQPASGEEMIKRGFDIKSGQLRGLPCMLRNIGVGPALNAHSLIENAEGEPRRWNFGAVPVAIGEEEMGCTHTMQLFLEQRDDNRVLVAYYEDVYGNLFESSREVSVSKERVCYEVSSLKVRKITKEEPTK